ncbi:MAG: hypothetical protein U0892_19770 [Pirellulales bacterium]
MTFWQRLPFAIFGIVVLLIVFILPFYLVFGGGMAKFALGPLRRRFNGISVREQPAAGDVSFVYHTYRGLLIWVTQDEHVVYATPDDAEILLKRLLKFNLTWGMLSYGSLFVPFLAIGNYKSQLKSIRAQASSLG